MSCATAAVTPLVTPKQNRAVALDSFPGWPDVFAGRALTETPLSDREKGFSSGFPGRIGRLTDGERQFIVRWICRESRKVHPSQDCFKGAGYKVRPLPVQIHPDNTRWGCFAAEKDGEVLKVSERISDDAGGTWTDVSSWYWSALLRRTRGPWWAVTIVEKNENGEEGQ